MTAEEFREFIYENNKGEDYGICPPPTDAQVALDVLAVHFLGENWDKDLPFSFKEELNGYAVQRIHMKYMNSKNATINVPPIINAQVGINTLIDILMPGWYCVLSVGVRQVNSEAVYCILKNYPYKRKCTKSIWYYIKQFKEIVA